MLPLMTHTPQNSHVTHIVCTRHLPFLPMIDDGIIVGHLTVTHDRKTRSRRCSLVARILGTCPGILRLKPACFLGGVVECDKHWILKHQGTGGCPA